VWVLGKLEKYLYRSATLILTSLPQAVDYIVTKGVTKDKVFWIPMGVDFDVIPDPIPPKEQPGFTIMYTGSHGYANDLDSILDTASIMKQEGFDDVQFVFIGDGPEKPTLQKRAEEEGLDNVVFKPPVPKADIYPMLQTADVLIVNLRDSPLYRYGISLNKMFDYLASARPIVMAADAPCNPVAEAEAGLVVAPQDAAAMAKAIRELMQMSPSERWEFGKRGRDYAEKHHDFEKIAANLEGALLGLGE
jgi:glycosyltransferase involved in cell wall biosynthesis